MEVVVAALEFAQLTERLFESAPAESAAFLAVEPAGDRLLVRSFHVFGPDELEDGGFGAATLIEQAQGRELAALRRAGSGLVEVHTHPGSRHRVRFSSFDEEELPRFARYVQHKLRGLPFGALVLGEEGYAGKGWDVSGKEGALHLRVIGQAADVPPWLHDGSARGATSTARFDRQVRALGPTGQARTRALRVGIVGLGGTGSQVAQLLAHLGIRDLVLVEDDRVEESNLPRLAGATWLDARLRRRKTAVSTRVVRRLAPQARIARTGPVRSPRSLAELRYVDLIVGCVDNDGARLVLAELAAAHHIPYLDIGVGIENDADTLAIGGRIAFYLPGGPCIACADNLDFDEAAEDLESEAARRIRIERGYARERDVEPSLMPLNTVLVGAAMIELLAFATGIRPVTPFLRYDALTAQMIRQNVERDGQCPICVPAYGMGDRHRTERYALA
jgi:molybdopterin/thiamine biosynthesis adenylyltransferase